MQIVRVAFIGLIICFGVFCGYLFSRILFRTLSVSTPKDSLKVDSVIPA